MTNDNYKKWEAIIEGPGELFFDKLHNQSGELVISLKRFDATDRILKITFLGILTYRITQEAGRLKTINDNYPLSTFNISNESMFLKWFDEESGGMFDDWSLMHIAICSSDYIIDVITNEKPTVEWF